MLNLSLFLESGAANYPEREAVVHGGDRLTYATVNALANQVANLLVSRGIRAGDKVAVSCPNIPAFPIVYNGVLKAGATVVPLNIMLKEREIAYHLNDSEAKAYLCFAGTPALPVGQAGRAAFDQANSCEHFFVLTADDEPAHLLTGSESMTQAMSDQPTGFETVATRPEDTAAILYSSGTTGQPKGAELSHSNLVLNALAANRTFNSHESRPDRYLLVLPLFHSFAQTMNMNAGFSTGATLVLQQRFDPDAVLDIMQRERITVFSGVPTMYWGLLESLRVRAGDHAPSGIALRLALSGGSPLPATLFEQFTETFGLHILEGYGLSETSPMALAQPPGGLNKPGSIGVPIWGVEARLVDDHWATIDGADLVGEIAVRGHNVMKGYFNRPDDTAAVTHNGWLRTGDIARRDEDGFYYIIDRAKDMIIRGGYNVYPREIEEALMRHSAVSLAAVIGVPNERHGEEVKAFVIPRAGSDITEADLVAWCKEQMANYKYPRLIEFVSELPTTETGKVLKRHLPR
jgi:long-chain acyl-CoA synthetase